jgi:hypothetical protein
VHQHDKIRAMASKVVLETLTGIPPVQFMKNRT